MTETAPSFPSDYESWDARDKADFLWNAITESAWTDLDRPPFVPPGLGDVRGFISVLRRSGLKLSLFSEADVLPDKRPKIIHTRGSVSRIEWELAADSPYTGILGPAAEAPQPVTGFIRMSLATPPKPTQSVVPGLAVKFPVNGRPALDLLAVHHTVGQGLDFDLFSNPLSHDLTQTHEHLRGGQKLMKRFFSRASLQPRRLSIDHFVSGHLDGTQVDDSARRRPVRLDFVPHDDVRGVFRGRHDADFRSVLAELDPGTRLYNVVAVEGGDHTHPLGSLRMTSEFVDSAVGDRLFFRHMQADEDLRSQLRPRS